MPDQVNRQWRLAARPTGAIQPGDFAWREEPVPMPGANQVLVRTRYLSLDPTHRYRRPAARPRSRAPPRAG